MKKQLSLLAAIAMAGLLASAQSGKIDGAALPSGISKVADSQFPAIKTAEAPVSQTLQGSHASVPTVAAVPGVATSYMPYYNYDLPDGYCNFYAFQFHALNALYYRGLVHSNTYNVDDREFICEWSGGGSWFGGEDVIEAACFVGDELWAYVGGCETFGSQVPRGLWTIDLASGQKDDCLIEHDRWNCIPGKADNINCIVFEMTYDPVTDYVYAVQRVATGWLGMESTGVYNILRVDPHNPKAGFEQVGTFESASESPIGMAADNGVLYMVTRRDVKGENGWAPVDAVLYKINLEDYASFSTEDFVMVNKINNGFLAVDYMQSMEFDHTTHTLWWAGETADGTAFFTTLNTRTGDTLDELVTPYGNYQYVAMAIPYQTAPDAAPSYVRNLTCTAAADGVQKVDFSWTNPSAGYNQSRIADLTAIKVYRDGKLIETLTPTGIGQKQTWADEGMTSGSHIYNFVACNSAGDGIGRERKLFVGRDVPGAVVDLKVAINGADATISWTPAERGAEGGWYDHSTLVYDVVRNPDKVKVATGISETSVKDHADVFRGYTYVVTPRNVDGPGIAKTSAVTPFGPNVEVPFKLVFSDTEHANMVTVVDGNQDGFKWLYGESASESNRVYNYGYCSGQADDYLVSPSMLFDPDKKYEIRFWYFTSVFTDTFERIEVRQGNAPTAEAQSTLLKTVYGYPENLGNMIEASAYIDDPSKGNYISIKAASDPDQGWISVSGFVIREYSATDLSVQYIEGPQYSYVNDKNKYTVTVRNEGYAAVENAKVNLVDRVTKQVLASAPVGTIEAGKSKDVDVIWSPTATNDYVMLSADVVIDGDTYPDDNIYDDYLEVQVTTGQASDWKVVGEYNNHGWRPLYSNMGISHTETIYSADEIGLGECEILGIAYTYDPAEYDFTGLDKVPAELYLCETADQYFDCSDTNKLRFFPANAFTPVYTGTLDLTSTKLRTDVTMMFDQPFAYSGKDNLVIKLFSDGVVTPDNVSWWITSEDWRWPAWDDPNPAPLQFRSLFSTDGTTIRLNDQIPVIKIAYKTNSGVQGIVSLNATFAVDGRAVVFTEAQDDVKVYDLAGRLICKGAGIGRTADLAPGIYTVVAKQGVNVLSGKVAIK